LGGKAREGKIVRRGDTGSVSFLYSLALSSFPGCDHPEDLGMENNKIKDNQLSASLTLPDMPAAFGRLNNIGWGYRHKNDLIGMWYQVEFIKRTKVIEIKTQGGTENFVKIFQISYSNNGIDFLEYVEEMGVKV
jgi:hypothetical protein